MYSLRMNILRNEFYAALTIFSGVGDPQFFFSGWGLHLMPLPPAPSPMTVFAVV